MALLASSLIDWNALGKIMLAALIGGAGVVIVFGILLLGLKEANSAKSGGARFAGYALSGICGLVCVAVLVIGIYAMAEKPASKAKKEHKTKSAAVLAPARSGRSRRPFKALDELRTGHEKRPVRS